MRKYLALIALLLLAAGAFAGRVDYLYAGAGTETPVYFDQSAGSVFVAGKTEIQGRISTGAGTAAAPEIFPGIDSDTGVAFPAANTVTLSTGGAARLTATNAGVTVVGTLAYTGLGYPDGAAATPAYSYASDDNTGAFLAGPDNLAWATGGVQRIDLSTTALTTTVPVVGPVGAAATPTYTYTGATDNGGFLAGADNIAWATNGVQRLDLSTTALTSTLPLTLPVGAVGAPSQGYAGDLTTGWYHSAASEISGAVAGVQRFNLTATGVNGTAVGATTPAAGAFTTLSATGALTNVVGSNVTYKYATAAWEVLTASATTRYLVFVPTDNVQIDEIYAWSYATPSSGAGTILLNVYANAAGPAEHQLQETADYDLEGIAANTGTNLPVNTTNPTFLTLVAGEPVYVTVVSNNAIGTNSPGGVTIKYHNR